MDQSFDQQYKNEILIGKLSTSFMAIAVFISCLGLFGLSSFMTERRVKEIGIRKVMGATVTQLVILLCRDFVLLVGMALIIGFPIAWWMGKQFLMTYAFRAEITVSIFVITGSALLAIALITVSYQSVRAAVTNPTNCLKNE
jgi:putative ABC transport system permease protein